MQNWINSRYQLIRKIKSGGTSTVYLAIDKLDTSEPAVALKVLQAAVDSDYDVSREFFEREVKALSSLTHPQIVRLQDYGRDEDSGCPYLALEYIERAETLRERRAKRTFDLIECLDLVIDLLSAVGYAHESGVIHRDLNPSNVLLDMSANPRIIDFGVSKILTDLTAGRTVADFITRPYASPEQVASQTVDFSSDVYSLAALLLFLITGGDPEEEMPLNDQFQRLSDIPKELRGIITKMAAVSPAERYRSASHAVRDLESARHQLLAGSRCFCLALTDTAIRNLYEQTAISSVDVLEAKRLILSALSGDVFAVRTEGAGRDEDLYDIVGSDLSLRCVPDTRAQGNQRNRLVVKWVRARLFPHTLEALRRSGLPIACTWHVSGLLDPVPSNAGSVEDLLAEMEHSLRRKLIQQEQKKRRQQLVRTWRVLLEVDSELKQESARKMEYRSWRYDEQSNFLRLTLEPDVTAGDVFFEGELLVMATKEGGVSAVGHYLRTEDDTILISKLPEVDMHYLAGTGSISADERMWAAAWKRQRTALNKVIDNRCANPRLPDVLIDPRLAANPVDVTLERFLSDKLDDQKRDVISAALGTRDVYLIQGPPGTGKTEVISEIVGQILTRDPRTRILLVSQSNVAVDHALAKVCGLLPALGAVRIGRVENIKADVQQCRLENRLAEWTKKTVERCRQQAVNIFDKGSVDKDSQAIIDLVAEVESAIADSSDELVNTGVELLREALKDPTIEPTPDCMFDLRRRVVGQKITPVSRVMDLWLRRIGKTDDFAEAYLQPCQLVVGTCVGVAGEHYLPERFDWVIVDEAGHATPSELLIPMSRGDRIILVGDHKQLPPVIDYDLMKAALERTDCDQTWLNLSLFEFLFSSLPDGLKAVLRTQYRMHPVIAKLISAVFYPEENLLSGVEASERVHGWQKWDAAVVWYSTSGRSDRGERRSSDGSICNPTEVEIVERELLELEMDLRRKGLRKNVGVISGYSAQVVALEQQLDPQDRSRWQAVALEINTVDAFQGRDRDIVFYSVVRSNPDGRIGFLEDCRRLNVALSRGRDLLCIVGDHEMVYNARVRSSNPFEGVITHITEHAPECVLVRVEDGDS